MPLLPFLLNKAVLVALSLIVIGSGMVYGGIKANDYRQTQIIVQEAKQLSSEGKYQEAINKLSESNNKWTTDGGKKEVLSLKEENRTLLESSSHYVLGKELFDKSKYADAVEILKKVDIRHSNYFDSKNLIELAEKKLDILKGEIAGVKTETKKTAQGAAGVLNTPITTPTPTPIPTTVPNVQTTQSISYPSPQTQNSIPQPIYRQPTASDYSQNFAAVIYGFDLLNKCYQQAISQITNGDRTGFNITLDQCRSIVSPLQSIIHQNTSYEVKRVETNLGSAWGQYNYLFSQMGSLSVSVDFSSSFQDDLKVNEGRYQKAVNYVNEAIKEWQAISQ